MINTCRLCLSDENNFLDIFSVDGIQKNIKAIIKQHFYFLDEIIENDLLSQKLCTSCWLRIESFHNFYLNVKTIHETFILTQNIQNKNAEEFLQTFKIEEEPQQYEPISNFFQVEIEKKESVDSDLKNNIDNEKSELVQIIKIENEEINNIFTETNNDNSTSSELDDELPLSKIIDKSRNNKIRLKKVATDKKLNKKTRVKKANSKLITKLIIRHKDLKDNLILNEDGGKKNDLKKDNINVVSNISNTKVENADDIQIREYCIMNCQMCTEIFKTFLDAKRHYRKEHQIAGFLICCKKKFFRRGTVKEHILWHTNPELFTCKECNKIYADKYGLDTHMYYHLPSEHRPHKCETCGKTFAKTYQLKQHIDLRHHQDQFMTMKFNCNECGKGFPSKGKCNTHFRIVHDKQNSYVCDICARVFKSRIVFDRHHNEIHLGIKPQKIQCQVCGAWLKHEHALRSHVRRHHENNDVEHICSICGKKSPNKDALKSHTKYVHIMEKKHKCTYCDKAFKKPKELREHSAQHTGEVLYKCLFCPRTFNSNANMHSHKLKKHKTEWEEYKNENN